MGGLPRFGTHGGRGSQHEVLAPVEQFTDGVQVTGMGGGLDQHMHQHGAEVGEMKSCQLPPVLRLHRRVARDGNTLGCARDAVTQRLQDPTRWALPLEEALVQVLPGARGRLPEADNLGQHLRLFQVAGGRVEEEVGGAHRRERLELLTDLRGRAEDT